jgi:CspA family cold shock protein
VPDFATSAQPFDLFRFGGEVSFAIIVRSPSRAASIRDALRDGGATGDWPSMPPHAVHTMSTDGPCDTSIGVADVRQHAEVVALAVTRALSSISSALKVCTSRSLSRKFWLSERARSVSTIGARPGVGRELVEEAVKMALGTVKWFNDAKGYGFISRADDGKDVFVHYSSIAGEGFRTLNQGQTVEYEEQQGPKGLFAAKVTKVEQATQ